MFDLSTCDRKGGRGWLLWEEEGILERERKRRRPSSPTPCLRGSRRNSKSKGNCVRATRCACGLIDRLRLQVFGFFRLSRSVQLLPSGCGHSGWRRCVEATTCWHVGFPFVREYLLYFRTPSLYREFAPATECDIFSGTYGLGWIIWSNRNFQSCYSKAIFCFAGNVAREFWWNVII